MSIRSIDVFPGCLPRILHPLGKRRDACRRMGRHARRMRSLHNRRKAKR